MNPRGIRDQLAILQNQNKQLAMQLQVATKQREDLMRIVMQLITEYGDEGSISIFVSAANTLDIQRSALETFPAGPDRMRIAYRDTVLQPTPNAGPALVEAEPRGPEKCDHVSTVSGPVIGRRSNGKSLPDLPAGMEWCLSCDLDFATEPEPEPEETAPPCGCGHERLEHVFACGHCRKGHCGCSEYAPVLAGVPLS